MQMKPSLLILFLIAYHLFPSETQGIRSREIVEVANALMETGNGGGGDQEIDPCTKLHFSSGKSRKLFISAAKHTSTSTGTLEKEAREEDDDNEKQLNVSASPLMVIDHTGRKVEAAAGKYDDLTDIMEMDYSPAKRKTPIHN
ncbi:hypothetical protein Dimus_023446 [Dionaea muscipula]